MSADKTLVLTETGVEVLPDGSSAVNVGPIVRALEFLTEGRGDDRGTDEQGRPLPDLMSLAFDVIESIILGGRKADYFRQVKRDLESQNEGAGQRSLALAKRARRVQPTAEATALDGAADALQGLLADLRQLSLEGEAAQSLARALESFRAFGADRWVSATAQLLLAVQTLGAAPKTIALERLQAPSPSKRKKTRKRRVAAPMQSQLAKGTLKKALQAAPKKAAKGTLKKAVQAAPKKAAKAVRKKAAKATSARRVKRKKRKAR